MEVTTFIPGEPGHMSPRHTTLLQSFRKTQTENRRKAMELYNSRKAEFDAMAEKYGETPPDNGVSDIVVGTEADLSGVPADRIINVTLDFSPQSVEKMLKTGELKRGREWSKEDAAEFNTACACGCGRRSPFPAPGEIVPEDWRPDPAERLFMCTDSVTPTGPLENRHAGHNIKTE